jgi:Substrate binding domain of ABC-type glycine betaine transport system
VSRFGSRVVDVINGVSARLTTRDLRTMNALVSVDGRSPAAVAAGWLVAEGFDTSSGTMQEEGSDGQTG